MTVMTAMTVASSLVLGAPKELGGGGHGPARRRSPRDVLLGHRLRPPRRRPDGHVQRGLGGALPPPVALKILGLLADEALPPRGAAATPRAERARACLAAQASTILSACAEPLMQQNGGASGDEVRALALGALSSLAPWLPPATMLDEGLLSCLPPLLGRAATRRPTFLMIPARPQPVVLRYYRNITGVQQEYYRSTTGVLQEYYSFKKF